MQWCCGVLLSDVQNSSEIASGFAFTFPMDLSIISSREHDMGRLSVHHIPTQSIACSDACQLMTKFHGSLPTVSKPRSLSTKSQPIKNNSM